MLTKFDKTIRDLLKFMQYATYTYICLYLQDIDRICYIQFILLLPAFLIHGNTLVVAKDEINIVFDMTLLFIYCCID